MSGAALPVSDGVPEERSPGLPIAQARSSVASHAAADATLLARARAGDREALAALVERHHAALAALVRQRAGLRAPVEDLLQETFARVLTHLPRFRERASFLTWTAAIALNLATDWLRKERRRARLAPRADVEGDDLPARGAHVDDAAQRREDAERARAALDALPMPLRIAVTLRVVQDLPYEDVAARLAVPVPRARTWVSRGLHRLRRDLEDRHD